ncbi:hypothetical protein R6Q59_032654, partial [Mikania micrantha]
MLWNKTSLEQPTVPASGVSRYLTPLWVSGNEEPQDGPCQSDSSSSQSIIIDTAICKCSILIAYKVNFCLVNLL